MRENKSIRFSSPNGDELIIISKDIFRVAELDEMCWGDNSRKGRAYEYCYDVIYNKTFTTLAEYELRDLIEEENFLYNPE